MLWDIPYSTNSNVIPGISIMMGHSRRPPQRIPIQLNVTKFGFHYITLEKYNSKFYEKINKI
jgi:hypothetical protein